MPTAPGPPTGRFGNKTLVYSAPETGLSSSYGNANVWTYNRS